MMKKGDIMTTAKQAQTLALIDAYLEGKLYISKHNAPPKSEVQEYWNVSDDNGIIAVIYDMDDVVDLIMWVREHSSVCERHQI